MPSREQYTPTYSSVPARITRPYLIPPIENDPLSVGVRGRRTRSANPNPPASVPAVTSVPYTAGGAQASPPSPTTRGAARPPQPAVQRPPSRQRVTAAPTTDRPASAARPAGTRQTSWRTGTLIGRVVMFLVFLVIIVVAVRPIVGDVLGDLFDGGTGPIEDTTGPDDTVDVDAIGSTPSTDELALMLAHPDEAAGHEFEAFVVIDSGRESTDGAAYVAVLSAFPPFSPDEIFYDREIELHLPADAAPLARNDLLHGTFRIGDEHSASLPTVEGVQLESTEYHDLADDVTVEQGETDDLGYVRFDVSVTNSADVPMTYALTLSITPRKESAVEETTAFVSTEEIAPGETVVLDEETFVQGAEGEPFDFSLADGDRY